MVYLRKCLCDDKLCEVSRSQIRGGFINIYGLFAKLIVLKKFGCVIGSFYKKTEHIY